MNKKTAITLAVIAGLAAVGYVVYRYMQSRAASAGGSPTGSFGSNLNSVAPELVGGSSGPSVGPALSAPVNITLNESAPAAGQIKDLDGGFRNPGGPMMTGVNKTTPNNPVYRQNGAAEPGVVTPDQSMTVDTGQEGDAANGE